MGVTRRKSEKKTVKENETCGGTRVRTERSIKVGGSNKRKAD